MRAPNLGLPVDVRTTLNQPWVLIEPGNESVSLPNAPISRRLRGQGHVSSWMVRV